METVWDWISVIGFAGLVTLFLQRSAEAEPSDRLWQYLPPALGCALGNYLGNEGYGLFAAATLVAVAIYVRVVLRLGVGGHGSLK